MNARKLRGLAAAAGLALWLAWLGGRRPCGGPGASQVLIKDFMFAPMELRIKAGSP